MKQSELHYIVHGYAVLAETCNPRLLRLAAEELLKLAEKLESSK